MYVYSLLYILCHLIYSCNIQQGVLVVMYFNSTADALRNTVMVCVRLESVIRALFNLSALHFGLVPSFLPLPGTYRGIRRDLRGHSKPNAGWTRLHKKPLSWGKWLTLWWFLLLPSDRFVTPRAWEQFPKWTYCGTLRYCFILFRAPIVIRLVLPPTPDEGWRPAFACSLLHLLFSSRADELSAVLKQDAASCSPDLFFRTTSTDK